MKKLVVAMALVFATLSGCTSSIPYTLSEEPQLIPVTIVDNRPAVEVDGGLPLSRPTYIVPATRFDPDLLVLLGHRLHREFGPDVNNWQIAVDRFQVANHFGASYRNAQAASAGAAAAGGDYALGAILSSAERGAIDAVIVEIEGQVNDVPFSGKSAVEYSGKPPSQLYMGMVYDNPSAREATRKAVELAIDNAVGNIDVGQTARKR